MTDLEKSLPISDYEILIENDMKIYDEYVIQTNVTSLGKNQDSEEYWDLYEVDSNNVRFDFNKLRRWKWCLTPIWGISGTSGSVISGQKIQSHFFGFDDVIPD